MISADILRIHKGTVLFVFHGFRLSPESHGDAYVLLWKWLSAHRDLDVVCEGIESKGLSALVFSYGSTAVVVPVTR